jgi:hypothetical protein
MLLAERGEEDVAVRGVCVGEKNSSRGEDGDD